MKHPLDSIALVAVVGRMTSRKVLDKILAKFILVGLANTIVGLGMIYAAKLFAGANDLSANIVGYAVGLAFSFAVNKWWTFGVHTHTLRSLLRFLAIFALAYPANLATVMVLIELGVNSYWSQALGVVPYTVLFYIGSRWYAFRSFNPVSHGDTLPIDSPTEGR